MGELGCKGLDAKEKESPFTNWCAIFRGFKNSFKKERFLRNEIWLKTGEKGGWKNVLIDAEKSKLYRGGWTDHYCELFHEKAPLSIFLHCFLFFFSSSSLLFYHLNFQLNWADFTSSAIKKLFRSQFAIKSSRYAAY